MMPADQAVRPLVDAHGHPLREHGHGHRSVYHPVLDRVLSLAMGGLVLAGVVCLVIGLS